MPTTRLDPPFRLAGKRLWVAGHRGMVGAALVGRLARENCDILTATRDELDLRRQADVEAWMRSSRPQAIIVAAATVGGIHANSSRPAEFIYDNLMIESNVVHAAKEQGVEKLMLLGSSCIYPRLASQPMTEAALLTGPLEPTNQWYAIAKIAGIKACQAYRAQHGCDFIAAQPTNLYGPNDKFDLAASHVIPALILKAHRAKVAGSSRLEIWGSGAPKREFLFVDDLADALVFLMKHYSGDDQINVGSGEEVTIRELAETVADVVGFKGALAFDASRPDGPPRKLLDSGRLHELGWRASTPLAQGLRIAYDWFLAHVAPKIAAS